MDNKQIRADFESIFGSYNMSVEEAVTVCNLRAGEVERWMAKYGRLEYKYNYLLRQHEALQHEYDKFKTKMESVLESSATNNTGIIEIQYINSKTNEREYITGPNSEKIELHDISENIGTDSGKIYFLFSEDKIVYVGKTKAKWPGRISGHMDKMFDSVKYIFSDPYALEDIERHYILTLSPEYNIAGKYESL